MKKQRYIARMDEVIITRKGPCAFVDYREKGLPGTQLEIGPEIDGMTDAEILEMFNEILRVTAQRAAEYRHVAVEVPLGSPQIEYHPASGQWGPRGSVLRCEVQDDENGDLVVEIDDRRLTLKEFGALVRTYAGWGMRIEFVPDDQVHRRPTLAIRDPVRE